MKGLYKAIGVGLVSLPLLLGGCRENKAKEYENLQGTVFSERYMPVIRGSWGGIASSRYSFSMDTEHGRKAVQVTPTRVIKKESIDALIEPGTKVEIEIKKDEKDKQVYIIPADKITVLE